MKKLLISGIDFSNDELEQRFEIEQSALAPMCLRLRIVDKDLEEDGNGVDATITLRASEMKALGKALVFAAEYAEEFYEE